MGKIVAIGSKEGGVQDLKRRWVRAQDREIIQKQRQRLVEAENQKRQASTLAAEMEKKIQEIRNLKQKVERTKMRIEDLEDEQSESVDHGASIIWQRRLIEKYQKEIDTKEKEVTALEKQAKNKEKAQTKVGREKAKLDEMEKERSEIEERLNRTKALDELKERENDLKRQNEKDQAIIQDENTSPSEREAAEARVAERNEELGWLQTQVEERETVMPLRERVREIFK